MSSPSTSISQWQNNGLWQQFLPAIGSPVPEQDDGIELPDIDFGMWERELAGHNTGQDSGSGFAQAIILETDTPTYVAHQPCKKKNGKGAEYSKKHRDKRKKLEQEMKNEMAKHREENQKLIKLEQEMKNEMAKLREENQKLIEIVSRQQQENTRLMFLVKKLLGKKLVKKVGRDSA